MLKRILTIMFSGIVLFTLFKAVESVKPEFALKGNSHLFSAIFLAFVWVTFIALEIEVFYNILYFGFARENKTDEKTAINIKCLIRAFISFLGSGTIFVFFMPLLVFLNVLCRIDYFFCRR